MKTCKNCKCELNFQNEYKSDKRFCNDCGIKRHDFYQGRRLVLYSLRALPLEGKIIKSKKLIEEAVSEFGIDHVYISYSGGKDSTVLSHIAKELYPNILHLFSNTTNEYPETLEHIRWERDNNHTNIITVIPKDPHGNIWTFKRVVEQYGYPMFSKRIANAIRTYHHARTPETKQHSLDYIHRNFKKYEKYIEYNISDMCCEKLKKAPLKKKAQELHLKCAILGTLASESYQREYDWLTYGCNVFYTKSDNQCRPLSFWTEKDISEYIQKYNLKISSLYAKGYSRNGCMYCGFGIQFETEGPNRFERLKHTHPVQYSYLIDNFGDFLIELEIIA